MRKWPLLALALVTTMAILAGLHLSAATPDHPVQVSEQNWLPITDEFGLGVAMRPGPNPRRPSLSGTFWAKRDGVWHPVQLEPGDAYFGPAHD